MFFFFLIGIGDTRKNLDVLQGVPIVCPNCHNVSVHAIRHYRYVTVFFIPILPFSWYKELRCDICGCEQPLRDEDIQNIKMQQQQQGGKGNINNNPPPYNQV
ncbi:unnamed protein product [Ambrosiozyma monospora]|uniref:Unnamed protein product n=1 Tax=Ambrosiozyma monospora TaxID=43982 RepID=A0A9W6Z2S3_AMBMO|nr:unnamed protein product [Ambrosiozyma monospora]